MIDGNVKSLNDSFELQLIYYENKSKYINK